jgi:hypothetical protein
VTLREAQRHHRMVWMLVNPFRQSGGRADAADGVLVDLSLMGYVNHRRREMWVSGYAGIGSWGPPQS